MSPFLLFMHVCVGDCCFQIASFLEIFIKNRPKLRPMLNVMKPIICVWWRIRKQHLLFLRLLRIPWKYFLSFHLFSLIEIVFCILCPIKPGTVESLSTHFHFWVWNSIQTTLFLKMTCFPDKFTFVLRAMNLCLSSSSCLLLRAFQFTRNLQNVTTCWHSILLTTNLFQNFLWRIALSYSSS